MANENLPNEHEEKDDDEVEVVIDDEGDDSDGDSRNKDDGEDHHEGNRESFDVTDAEREAIRERRRKERHDKKQAQRDREDTLKRELAARDRMIAEQNERLSLLERKSAGGEMAQLDAGIKQASDATAYFEQVIAQASAANDGPAVAQAVRNMMAAEKKAQELTNIKKAYMQRNNQPAALDPRLVSHAQKFMDENPWYNPKAGDVDSKLALTLDNEIASRGYNPANEDYWDELNKSIEKYLPHRSKTGNVNPARQESRKSVVTGSGRESSSGTSKSTYTLSPERVQALKDAGMWDDPAARDKAVKRYREYDKQNTQR